MVTITVKRRFYDLRGHEWRQPGDMVHTTGERAAEIMAALPGYVEVHEEPKADLSRLTVEQLRAMCAERGIDVPRRAKKDDYIRLLEA